LSAVAVAVAVASLAQFDRCFQQWMFTFLWVSEWSLALASDSNSLTAAEPQQSYNSFTRHLTDCAVIAFSMGMILVQNTLPLFRKKVLLMQYNCCFLFAEPLLSTGCCIVAYFFVVTWQ
jgi:hypothetical protein